jgi:hypothetical protein
MPIPANAIATAQAVQTAAAQSQTQQTRLIAGPRAGKYHEAFWSTGVYQPANYLPPNPPISQAETTQFIAFHQRANGLQPAEVQAIVKK